MSDANDTLRDSPSIQEEASQKMEEYLKVCEMNNPSKRYCREGAQYHSALPVGSVLF